MVDFSARIRMLPRQAGRSRASAGTAWCCRLRVADNCYFASLISRDDFLVPDRTDQVYVTLLHADARPFFEPGTVFDIIDDDQVATGVVDRADPSAIYPRDYTHPVLQSWARRRPEWFIRTRLELHEQSAGWSDLIDKAFSAINEVVPDRATDFRIMQVKQKLGALVIYVGHQLRAEVSAIIQDYLNDVQQKSLTTCELCGRAGSRGSQSGYICVRCLDCAPENWSQI